MAATRLARLSFRRRNADFITAVKYGIGVGRPGFEETRMAILDAALPDAAPPSGSAALHARGPENPLGTRAMYLGGSLYRIHGSNEPQTIGQAVSSGCICMTNEDVVDL
jgi:lipoprotein-anchoring transpeptidase ErfK/SrfK